MANVERVIIMNHLTIKQLPYGKTVGKWLKDRYGVEEANRIWRKTRKNYQNYLSDLPDYGGRKNGHADDLLTFILWCLVFIVPFVILFLYGGKSVFHPESHNNFKLHYQCLTETVSRNTGYPAKPYVPAQWEIPISYYSPEEMEKILRFAGGWVHLQGIHIEKAFAVQGHAG